MKILFVELGTFGKEDVKRALIAEGHKLIMFPFTATYETISHDLEAEKRLRTVLHREVPDIVFSLNYLPLVSRVCQKEKARYISWLFDSPCFQLYSITAANPCNIIYVFDKEEYLTFRNAGITTVYYLPLAVDTDRLEAGADSSDGFEYDVSFVGSLYMEKLNYFPKVMSRLPEYARGYIDALIAAQMKIWGYNFIQDLLQPVIDDLYQAYPVDPEPDGTEPREFFYAQYVINRRITTMERIELLMAAASEYAVELFTYRKDFTIPNVHNHGPVDYFREMPSVFRKSRINLNISGRLIKSGVPLRAFDVMGAGGFLLSNYQADFLDLFVPGEDFVYYESKEDLLDKIGYYLSHENERQAIAKNGHDKVAAGHTYRHRVQEILSHI